MVKSLSAAAVLFAAVFASASRGEVVFPHIISDHAVLQRDRPIHLWGWATPGAHLSASFHHQQVPAIADPLGKWSLYLQPESAGGPYVLTVRGDGPAAEVQDILVGDVWLASGQSNMEMPLGGFTPQAHVKDAAQEIATAKNPQLRLLLVEHKSSDFPVNDITTKWTTCTPDTAKSFSAVAYFFAREIAAKEHVPIGVIDTSWGGTPADSWVSMNMLGSDPALLPAFASRAAFADKQTDLTIQLVAEKREDEAAKAEGKPAPAHGWHPDETAWLPAALYNGMIAPFTPMTLRGFLWYQGEANSSHDRAPYYGRLLAALITDWRTHFAQGNLPFLYAQISSFQSPGEDWGTVRDQQRRVLVLTDTAMAVTLDVGQADNVHPPDKQTVGARLALGARALSYGEPVAYQGPLFREATLDTATSTEAMRVWFDHAHGLTFRGKAPSGFEIAGPDHHFVPAQASVQGETVVVKAAAVPHPSYVRFGYNSFVTDSFYNDAGLPASTFSSEPDAVH